MTLINTDETVTCKCPRCGEDASRRTWEAVTSGTINQHWQITCGHCGLIESDPFAFPEIEVFFESPEHL